MLPYDLIENMRGIESAKSTSEPPKKKKLPPPPHVNSIPGSVASDMAMMSRTFRELQNPSPTATPGNVPRIGAPPGLGIYNRVRDWMGQNSGNTTIPLPGYRDNPNYQPTPSTWSPMQGIKNFFTPPPPGFRSMPRPSPTPGAFPMWGSRSMPGALNAYPTGQYPQPQQPLLPDAYDSRISGGMLG